MRAALLYLDVICLFATPINWTGKSLKCAHVYWRLLNLTIHKMFFFHAQSRRIDAITPEHFYHSSKYYVFIIEMSHMKCCWRWSVELFPGPRAQGLALGTKLSSSLYMATHTHTQNKIKLSTVSTYRFGLVM